MKRLLDPTIPYRVKVWAGRRNYGEVEEREAHFNKNVGTYKGQWQIEGSVRQGRGTMRYKNQDVYEGWWFDGLREGMGRMLYISCNEAYIGMWKEGMRHGKGT